MRVLAVRDGSTITTAAVLPKAEARALLAPCRDADILLCSDSNAVYRGFSERAQIAHTPVSHSGGNPVLDPARHIHHANAYHSLGVMSRAADSCLLSSFRWGCSHSPCRLPRRVPAVVPLPLWWRAHQPRQERSQRWLPGDGRSELGLLLRLRPPPNPRAWGDAGVWCRRPVAASTYLRPPREERYREGLNRV